MHTDKYTHTRTHPYTCDMGMDFLPVPPCPNCGPVKPEAVEPVFSCQLLLGTLSVALLVHRQKVLNEQFIEESESNNKRKRKVHHTKEKAAW